MILRLDKADRHIFFLVETLICVLNFISLKFVDTYFEYFENKNNLKNHYKIHYQNTFVFSVQNIKYNCIVKVYFK